MEACEKRMLPHAHALLSFIHCDIGNFVVILLLPSNAVKLHQLKAGYECPGGM